ncbi:cache domain-containing protein [uncultured Paracoccus sp.]|uniref:sensor histidine kinase n=1 Tax=uncultured Paracoccus sp. TaxID=189685 RepID=UPI003454C776
MGLATPFRRSVRLKLLAIALLPMLVLLPILLGATVMRWAGKTDDLLIVKANGDLTIAHEYLGHLIASSGERLATVSESAAFQAALASGQVGPLIDRERTALGLDFLYIARADEPETQGWPVIETALQGRVDSAIDLFDAETLTRISPLLAERARIAIVPTRAAVSSDRKAEDRGLVVHAAAPLTLPDGRPAALVGGMLLNRNLGFIDTINNLVYSAASLPEGSQGTATLFLDDVRISTNVRMFGDQRALGTRVSAEVRKHVLDEGRVWLARAFVVNDWYVSGYEPITDSFGNRVGMLYAGFLETPFRQDRLWSIIGAALLFLAIAALSVPLFLTWAGRIFRPLEQMTRTMAEVEAGDLAARNGGTKGEDEIAQVASHLDTLLDQVQERDRSLRAWAATLEDKVEERTRDLREAKEALEQATQQLVMSEKLAAVGEITASVAHEINNPVAVIQGNLDVARETLGARATEVRTEFDLIDDQLYRISTMVSKLLQFARPGEFSGAENLLIPGEVINDCLVLVRHVIDSAGIRLDLRDEAQGRIRIDQTELQQVIVNLIVNAAHAMPEGGRLQITTADRPHDGAAGVEITISDSGHGMDAATLEMIFHPFFTTKRASGTGLGLSISQSLVTRAGGFIAAESRVGEGSRFRIWLPEAVEL